MTIVASFLFLSALAASAFAIASTIGNAMPRIREEMDAQFGPKIKVERRITFGEARYASAARMANVVAFPLVARAKQDFKLAA